MVPKTITFGEYKQKQTRQGGGVTKKSSGGATAAGQKTLDQMKKKGKGKPQDSDVEMGDATEDEAEANNESLRTDERADDETVSDGGTPPPPAPKQRRRYDPVRDGSNE